MTAGMRSPRVGGEASAPAAAVEIDAQTRAELAPPCDGHILHGPAGVAQHCPRPAAWATYLRGCTTAAGPWLFCDAHQHYLVSNRRSIVCTCHQAPMRIDHAEAL